MRVFLIVVCFVAYSSAHMCLISPPQRGSMMGINKQGANDCVLTKMSCGGRMATSPSVGVRAGMNFTVTFQKNLDHWVKATPGYFSISMGTDDKGTFKELARINDMGEPSLTLFSRNVTIPDNAIGMSVGVIQVTYVTKNPDAPAVFYQCSDVYVFRD
ncbi:uncharacterized protein [Amphiura filiformis]|uniref:uncharacterized protein n=1 Tax=Amphiura filiformis TaxID=82378 RepID=UPI003B210208